MQKISFRKPGRSSCFKTALAFLALIGLAGCDAITSFNLNMTHQKLREECFAHFSNHCNNKTAKYNIKVIKATPLAGPQTRESIMENFGQPGWELWEEVEKEAKRVTISAYRDMRPNWFSRWFLGEAQPFSGKQVLEISPGEIAFLQQRTLEVFMKRAQTSGLRRKNSEAPATTRTPAVQSAAPSLAAALEKLIEEETSAGGGSEFQEARQVVQVDLNGDGIKDAVALFSIEGQGRGNSAYQNLAAFYQQPDGWVAAGRVTTGGLAKLRLLGENLFELTELTYADADPRCCPSLESKVTYSWTGTHFALQE